jgi:hypothetical protein
MEQVRENARRAADLRRCRLNADHCIRQPDLAFCAVIQRSYWFRDWLIGTYGDYVCPVLGLAGVR